tara:strand:- start:716 stop:1231 length:516 start_codon:yes stop_codon:yes gene_type:complete
MSFNIITAIFKNGGMGKIGDLPWDLAGPYSRYFSKLTIGNRNNAVIMGSTTFDDMMCYKYFPLSNRRNLVMSTNPPPISAYPNVEYFKDIDNVKSHCKQEKYDDVWIIGGVKTYREFLLDKSIKNIYYYHINKDHDSDMYFPIKMNNNDGNVLFSYKEEGIEHSFVHHKIM